MFHNLKNPTRFYDGRLDEEELRRYCGQRENSRLGEIQLATLSSVILSYSMLNTRWTEGLPEEELIFE